MAGCKQELCMVEGCRLPWMVDTVCLPLFLRGNESGATRCQNTLGPVPQTQRPHRCVLGSLAALGPGGTLPLCARHLPAHIKLVRGYTENKVDNGR